MSTNFWEGRSVLVTGAAGLLGGWVCRMLADSGARVGGLDIDWSHGAVLGQGYAVKRIDGDIRDRDVMDRVLRNEVIDTVVHLAAQAIVGPANEDPVETFEHNILGTWTVLDACRADPTVESIVVTSSDKAYGDHGGIPYEESMPLLARHPYAASKTCADVLAQTYAETYRLPVVIARSGNMYGGGDIEWSRIVPGTIRSVLSGQRPVIRSDGSYVRDYLYVEDVAGGVITLARMLAERRVPVGEEFNFAAEERLSASEMVRAILHVMGSDLEPDILGTAIHEIPEQRVSAKKARDQLGWTPEVDLEEGLSRSVSWYRRYLSAAGTALIISRRCPRRSRWNHSRDDVLRAWSPIARVGARVEAAIFPVLSEAPSVSWTFSRGVSGVRTL